MCRQHGISSEGMAEGGLWMNSMSGAETDSESKLAAEPAAGWCDVGSAL